MSFDYYKAPEQRIFEDIKQAAIQVWSTYDDTHKYATEKINKIKTLQNVADNAWYIIAMFDVFNQIKLVNKLCMEDSKKAVQEMCKANS